MRANMNLEANQANTARKSDPKPPLHVWIGGVAVRTLFLIVLTVLTARVASPQIERLTSLYETPGDLIRVLMGFVRGLSSIFSSCRRTPVHTGPGCISVLRFCRYRCSALSSSGKRPFTASILPHRLDRRRSWLRPCASSIYI
jgi:hypothetical protein